MGRKKPSPAVTAETSQSIAPVAIDPAVSIAGTLGLVALALLPLAGGGYSGAGYLLALVLLPLCTALAWPKLAERRLLVQTTLLAYALSGVALPFMLQEGRDLWGWMLPLPLAWVITTLILEQLPERRGLLLPALAGGAIVSALYGLTIWTVSASQGQPDSRLSATFGLPNAYAGYLLLAWPVAAMVFLQASARLQRILYGTGTLVLLVALVLTYSRASWYVLLLQLAGMAVVLVGSLVGQRQETQGKLRTSWMLLVTPVALLSSLVLLPSVRSFIARAADFGGYSMQGRLRFWESALDMWADHPLFGIGPGAFGYVYPQYQRDIVYYSIDPHSWPLQLVSELGIPGLFIVLAIAVGIVLWLRRVWVTSSRTHSGDLPGPIAHVSLHPTGAALLTAAVVGSLAHAAVDFDYTFSATTSLLGALLAYGTWRSGGGSAGTPDDTQSSQGHVLPPLVSYGTAILLVVITVWGVAFSAERYILDRLRDTAALSAEVRLELLRQAVRYNPWNHATHYRLAEIYAEPGALTDRNAALRELDTALDLNPRYTPALTLRGVLKRGEAGEADAKRSLDLDPWNYPTHYFAYAMLAKDPAERERRLQHCVDTLGVRDPILPDSIRPDWVKLNGMFALLYYELARLAKDEGERTDYRHRAARFDAAAKKYGDPAAPERKRTSRVGGSDV